MPVPQYNTIHQLDKVKSNHFLGSTFEILKNPVGFLAMLAKNYDSVVYVSFGGKKYYVLQHPDYTRHVLLENYKGYCKPGATKLLRMFLGEGLTTSNGELWLRQRKSMQRAFHTRKMEYFTGVINEEVTGFIDKLNKKPDYKKIDINHELLELTIRIISRSMFGFNFEKEVNIMVNVLEELSSYAASWMKSPVKIPISWQTPANKAFKKNCEVFDTIIYRIIGNRRNEMAIASEAIKTDLLDIMLSLYDQTPKSSINEKLLRDEVTNIFMAGHETTAQALSWTFYLLAKEKKINEKVKAESSSVLGNHPVVYQDIPKLGFTKQVIKEALRLYPPVWAIVRVPIEADRIFWLSLPQKSKVLLNIYGLHHHPNYWEKPETFYPEHFSEANEKARPAFVYMPFGGGPRLCIGHNFAMLIMQIVLCRISQVFEFSVPENYVPVVEPNITLRAKPGIQLIIKKIPMEEKLTAMDIS